MPGEAHVEQFALWSLSAATGVRVKGLEHPTE